MNFINVTQGETLTPGNLDPGIYTVKARLGGCVNFKTVSIQNNNPPSSFDPTVTLTQKFAARMEPLMVPLI
ncbi:hypothetical protein QWY93_18900 [Echinicola jeungdonensis]|nr:hypothetical protein [Echinicola jeungdonensis]MDN3671339.1 hypothetical protein [Echinicola jeungdonensis]